MSDSVLSYSMFSFYLTLFGDYVQFLPPEPLSFSNRSSRVTLVWARAITSYIKGVEITGQISFSCRHTVSQSVSQSVNFS